jgi:hypothetical protein
MENAECTRCNTEFGEWWAMLDRGLAQLGMREASYDEAAREYNRGRSAKSQEWAVGR